MVRFYRVAVSLLLIIHGAALVWVASILPIGPHEAWVYFTHHDAVAGLMHLGRALFPDADFLNIRFPFLTIHLINLYLFYHLSRLLLKDETAQLTSFLLFLLLPGIVSSAILATSTGLILTLYQLFLYFRLQKNPLYWAVLPLFLLVDRSSVIFYFALSTYALYNRDRSLLGLSVALFTAALLIYGFDVRGKPVNFFVDTVGLYAAIFSPLVFLYFFYAMYRILLKGDRDIIWHIGFVVLILSLALSVRQRIPIEDFAPYVVVAIPAMVRLFFRSYRVRLPQFRKNYFRLAVAVIGVLVINTAILIVHRPFFLLLDRPARHFAAPFYFPYWCAQSLHAADIRAIHVRKREQQMQLRYYNIGDSDHLRLDKGGCEGCLNVTIRYKNRILQMCHVSKIHK